MDRRHFLNLFLTSAGASLLSASGLRLNAAEPSGSARDIAAIENSKLGPVCRICYKCLDIVSEVRDFEAIFIKKERNGNKLDEVAARIKIRHEPLSVYMIFGKPHEGREVIWVDGRNGGNILVHETGLKSVIGTIEIDPHGKFAMGNSHYPITYVGLPRTFKQLLVQWEHDAIHTPEVEVKFYRNGTIGDIPCQVIETRQPRKPGVHFALTRLYLHAETHLPVRTQQYKFSERAGGEPVLYEEYTYLDMKTNVGLTDLDFDPANPKYNF